MNFIGNKVHITPDTAVQTQREYASKLETATTQHKPLTPLPFKENERADTTAKTSQLDHKNFRTKLGRILFLARDSRPDLAFAASHLGTYAQGPTHRAMNVANRVTTYAKRQSLHIPLPRQPHPRSPVKIEAYVDASMGNENDAYGTTGWIILCNGMPLQWKSKRQQRVARSSLKAELIAMDDLLDSILWTSQLFYNEGVQHNIHIYCDSQDLVQLLTSKYPKPKTKSDIFVIEELRRILGMVASEASRSSLATLKKTAQRVEVTHIEGKTNPADALTKATSAQVVENLRRIVTEVGFKLRNEMPRRA